MENTPHNVRVALYCRVSTEEQREGQTIESQVSELERFAQEKGWTTIGIYKDEGWSGSLLARPELDRLRDDASRGLLDTVLINDVDRLARDVTHLGVISVTWNAALSVSSSGSCPENKVRLTTCW